MFFVILPVILFAFMYIFLNISNIFNYFLFFAMYLIGYATSKENKYVVALSGIVSYIVFAVIYNISFLSFFGSIFFYLWAFIILGMIEPDIELKLKEMKK